MIQTEPDKMGTRKRQWPNNCSLAIKMEAENDFPNA